MRVVRYFVVVVVVVFFSQRSLITSPCLPVVPSSSLWRVYEGSFVEREVCTVPPFTNSHHPSLVPAVCTLFHLYYYYSGVCARMMY